MITIYDIAKQAGVSIATVSRVLNNPEKVTPRTREKVEQVLARTNYVPSVMARTMTGQATKMVGILLSDVSNLHFMEYVSHIEKALFGLGYTTLLCNAGDDPEKRIKYIQILSRYKIDGLILLGSVFDSQIMRDAIAEMLSGIPVVASNMITHIDNWYSVQLDQGYGMEMVIQHLAERKYKDIRFIYSNHSLNTKRKIQGFAAAMKKFGFPYDENENLAMTDRTPEGGRRYVLENLEKISSRSALIFMEDVIAAGAVAQLNKQGIKIPEEVGVVGYDNSIFSSCTEPLLTTVDTQIAEMSDIMANTMHDLLAGRKVGHNIMIYPKLVIRETT